MQEEHQTDGSTPLNPSAAISVEPDTFREERRLKSIAVDPDGNPWVVNGDGPAFSRSDPSRDAGSLSITNIRLDDSR
jgi:hypothetical protein